VLHGVFVTGTDTGVGKTVVSAALLARFGQRPSTRYWKPIQTGIEQDDDTAEVLRLSGVPAARAFREGVRLPRPLSPHLSASLAGAPISLPPLMELAWSQPERDRWIVEGAGGVLVPLNDHELMVDLISVFGLPAVIAARSGLGTINHTLLTVEALRSRGVPIAGVVMVGVPNADNRVAIETRGHVQVIGELPHLAPLTPESLQAAAASIARGGELDVFFQDG
jgi:dethiobiotin synthase